MEPIAETGEASICLNFFLFGIVCNKEMFIATAFQLCFNVCH